MEGGWKTPPSATTRQKKPSAYRVKKLGLFQFDEFERDLNNRQF